MKFDRSLYPVDLSGALARPSLISAMVNRGSELYVLYVA